MLKAILVPLVIGFITWLSKRVSPQIAGMLAGMPITGGPILLLLTLEHDALYASDVATATISSVAAMSSAMLIMALLSGWLAILTFTVATALYFAMAWLMLPLPTYSTLLFSLICWLIAPRLSLDKLPQPDTLVVRMIVGFCLTALILWIGPMLSSSWAGILTGYPFAAMIIAMFVQKEQGAEAAKLFNLGALQAMATTGVFYWLVATLLPVLSLLAFVIALVVLVLLNLLLIRVLDRTKSSPA